jgi:hypothetical protein
MTNLNKKVIDGVAPVTLADCVYMGDGTTKTIKQVIDTILANGGTVESGTINGTLAKIDQIKDMYPQCTNFKGSFDWNNLTEQMWDNCQKGDFWINDKTTELKAMHCYIHYPNDVMYWDGTNITPLKVKVSYGSHTSQKYDICIVGAGAGGMGAAYALKDKGYNVIIVDKLDVLGGTHLNAMPSILPSPITGTWFKNIMRDAYNDGRMAFNRKYEVGEGDTFDKLWRGGYYNWGTTVQYWGNTVEPAMYWTSQRYLKDLRHKIDIRLNTELLSVVHEDVTGGKKRVGAIKVRDLAGGKEYTIHAEYFIDCSADGVLCRSGMTEGVDYFIGSDSKATYNESAYPDGYVADRYNINTVEAGYRHGIDSYLPGDKMRFEDRTKWKKFDNITGYSNGTIVSQKEGHSFTSTSRGNEIDPVIFIDKGNDYAHAEGYYRTKHHLTLSGYSGHRYMEQGKMLGIRESYRIKCDRMLTQADTEIRMTSALIVPNKVIALSSWWCDLHNDIATQNGVNNSFLNGIGYDSITPSAFTNVLIGSRCFGASHLALANLRLIKVMMSLGYACGHAMSQCVDGWLNDVRDVDIAKLQADIEIQELMTEMETHFPPGYNAGSNVQGTPEPR